MAENNVQERAAEGTDGAERERSTISFPYNDLDTGIRVARAIHEVGGSSCQRDQLAAKLKVQASGGGFSLLNQTAKIFGLITYGQGTIQLTPLGSRICDAKHEKAARVEAFLAVPLYKAIYDKYKGLALPPSNALEAEMAALGVAKKQTDKARQSFQRSANQAGFFWSGTDRLVVPPTGPTPPPAPDETHEPDRETNTRKNGGGGGGGEYHPFIEGLLRTLPPPETEWKADARKKWLQTAANVFSLIYTDASGESKELVITLKEDSAK